MTHSPFLATRPGGWLLRELAAHAPAQVVSSVLDSEGNLSKERLRALVDQVLADEGKRRFVLETATTAILPGRRAGYDNDMARFAAIDSLELEAVEAPCLVVQGTADSDLLPADSDFAAATISHAELLLLEGGTHLAFWTNADAARAQARALTMLAQDSAHGGAGA